jgi:hypothetical protein
MLSVLSERSSPKAVRGGFFDMLLLKFIPKDEVSFAVTAMQIRKAVIFGATGDQQRLCFAGGELPVEAKDALLTTGNPLSPD